jgi:hypothetical protein
VRRKRPETFSPKEDEAEGNGNFSLSKFERRRRTVRSRLTSLVDLLDDAVGNGRNLVRDSSDHRLAERGRRRLVER